MSKRLMTAALTLTAFVATAAEKPAIDAFLARRDVKPLVTPGELSRLGREALSAGLVTSTEPRLGVPTFFWAARPPAGTRTFADQGLTAEQAARRFLVAHAELYRGSVARWAEARVSHVHDLHDGSAVIVTFQQRVGGVRVFRDELKVIMTAKLELVALAGALTPELKVRGEFALAPASAIASAFENLTGSALEPSRLQELGTFGGGYQHHRLAGAETPVRTRPVYFPLPDGLVPGFYVELDVPTSETDSEYFAFVVSAVDGAVLFRKNLTAAHSYRVWADATPPHLPLDGPQGSAATPHPTGTTDGFNPGTVPQTLVTLVHAGLSTGDRWLPAMASDTRGNNVSAYADIARSNGYTAGSDVLPTTTDVEVFDYPYDFALSPSVTSQRAAAVVQLFYDNNFFHDWFYDLGFDEAAGNAQVDNRGRGGLGNDPLRAEAQDYSGRNNANMSTPSDGAPPRMQMYVFDGTETVRVTAHLAQLQTYGAVSATFGPVNFDLRAPFVVVNDGDSTPTDGCGTTFDAAVSGKIAIIDRGTCTFVQKVVNAQANGAIGVIIANNQGGAPPDLVGTPSTPVTIPAVSVSQSSGAALKALAAGTELTLYRLKALDRDGTLDNGVVAHEWGHFISNRLIGDGTGISNNQAVGMGEGWGDFHSALLLAREGDDQVASNSTWNGVYSLSGWASYAADTNGYYFGFRRYPLSWDLQKNPLTFKHIQEGVRLPTGIPVAFGSSGQGNSEVHATGEVWAVMLWDCYVSLLRDSRYTFTQARDLMRAYLVAAYKATPLMPTFVDARDALLAVAAARDTQDFAQFWAAFARRGLGMGAVAPDRDSQTNTPVTESFVVGNAIAVTGVTLDDATTSCDMDGHLDANEAGVLHVKLRNTGTGALTAATLAVASSTTGISFPSGASFPVPSVAPFGAVEIAVPVALADVAGTQGGVFTLTVTDASLAMGPLTHQALFRLNYDIRPNGSAFDDVEAPMSQWTSASDPNGATGSNFRIFQSTATEHFWFGPNPASPADTWLISPPLSVGAGNFVVTFKHRWDFERSNTENFDGAVVEVSTDGRTWTDVGASARPGYNGTLSTSSNQSANPLRGRMAYVAKSAGYPAFVSETVDLGTRYAGQTVRFRFRIGADDSAAAKGWEIDDIRFAGLTNLPFSAVVSDPNTCTNAAPVATVGMNLDVEERTEVTLGGSATDADGDAVTLAWTQVGGPMVTLTEGRFTAPEVSADTLLEFEFTATDGRATTVPALQTVLVRNVNRAPLASAPAVIEVEMGAPVTVLGTASDPDGDAVTVEWTQVSGPEVGLTGATTATLAFTAPTVLVQETVRVQLVARDGSLASAPAVVDVVVKNPAPAVNPVNPTGPGCGCTAGVDAGLLALGALALALRRRRR